MDFAEFIADYDDGRLNQQLGEQLAHIIDGTQVHNTPGEIVLKLSFRAEGGRAVVTPNVRAKIPTEPMASTLWFFDNNNGISRDNPRQLKLKVPGEHNPVTGEVYDNE